MATTIKGLEDRIDKKVQDEVDIAIKAFQVKIAEACEDLMGERIHSCKIKYCITVVQSSDRTRVAEGNMDKSQKQDY